MGCDIRMFTEVKAPQGSWHCHTQESFFTEEDDGFTYPVLDQFPDLSRDDTLFGLLSEGVRIECEFAFPQRGVPEDVSYEVGELYKFEDADAHSANWLTFNELQEKAAQLLFTPGERAAYCLQQLQALLAELRTVEEAPENIRIVFWFDN